MTEGGVTEGRGDDRKERRRNKIVNKTKKGYNTQKNVKNCLG